MQGTSRKSVVQVVEARRRHEASAQEERKNAIAEWLDLLASQVMIHFLLGQATAAQQAGALHATRRRIRNNDTPSTNYMLTLQDDAAWKENLIGMGSGPGVPKLLHHNGKVS